MKIKYIVVLFALFFLSKTGSSSTVSGKVMDTDSVNLSFSTVYVKNTTYGVVADFNGNYFIELEAGTYTLVYSYLGYKNFEKTVTVTKNKNLKINVFLEKSDVQIADIEIVSNKVNKAKRIVKLAKQKRNYYLTNVESYECKSYIKTSIENESEAEIIDSTKSKKDFETYLKNEKLNLIEYVAYTYFKKPGKLKENIIAYHKYTEDKPFRGMSVSASFGEHDIAPQQYHSEDPFVFYKNSTSGDFNFYENSLNFPSLCNQSLVSPIASNSGLYYKYEFDYSFIQNGTEINKIKVTPLNKLGSLFYGNIYIEDSTWALVSVDLSINEGALTLYENFNIIQNYQKINDSIYLPVRTDIIYTIKDGKKKVLGNTQIIRKEYIVNQEIKKIKFNNEIITYEEDAFDKDSVYWSENRLITLKDRELKFIDKSDSLQAYYISDEYLDERDSIFNRVDWWIPLRGYGHTNHYTGNTFYISGIPEQIVPFGVGGYRHRLPFYVNKEFKNDMLLETKATIDYGFLNKDFKGKLGVGLTYFPKKFVRTYIDIGDYYDMINNFASIEQTFSRSNYVRTKTFGIKQRMEIFNGLFAELSFIYSNQLPINDIQLAEWSDLIFGDLNEPIDFEQYVKSEIKLELKYRIGQKYIIKKNKKVIIGTDYPEIVFIYRKGINGLLGSEVDFDYIEIGAKDDIKLARFGESRWQIKAGIFTNKKDLRVLEHKYFRGSDTYFFSDPVLSMQLLGYTLNTNNEFLQANYIHHFNGTILNKVPLVKYLKLTLAGGAGTLNIPEQDFYHVEFFAGLERVVKIKKQLFRFGLYGVTADNSVSAADIRLKAGVTFFNPYTDKWGY